MDIRGNETLREMLAAEYAVGTLSGGARRRFERWMREDAALRRLAFKWSERLAPLTAGVEPVAPPERVWIAIQTRMRGARAAPVAVPWWDRVGLWRGLAGAFATVALVALAVALRESTIERPTTIVRVEQPAVEAPPKIVQAPPKIIEAPPKIVESPPKIVEVPALPDAVATIVDPKSGAPVAVVFEADHGNALLVKVAGNVDVAAGKDLQLWMAPATRREWSRSACCRPTRRTGRSASTRRRSRSPTRRRSAGSRHTACRSNRPAARRSRRTCSGSARSRASRSEGGARHEPLEYRRAGTREGRAVARIGRASRRSS